jgi:hypothetical protein
MGFWVTGMFVLLKWDVFMGGWVYEYDDSAGGWTPVVSRWVYGDFEYVEPSPVSLRVS